MRDDFFLSHFSTHPFLSISMTRVPRHFIASRARHHASRFLLPDTKWFKLLSLYLFETLEEEYNKFPSLFALSKKNKKTKEGENSEAAPTRRCRTSRQVSQYVLFCRHMKQHQPTVTNLQNVWKQVKKHKLETAICYYSHPCK